MPFSAEQHTLTSPPSPSRSSVTAAELGVNAYAVVCLQQQVELSILFYANKPFS